MEGKLIETDRKKELGKRTAVHRTAHKNHLRATPTQLRHLRTFRFSSLLNHALAIFPAMGLVHSLNRQDWQRAAGQVPRRWLPTESLHFPGDSGTDHHRRSTTLRSCCR